MGTRAVIDFLLAPLGRSRARSGDTARDRGTHKLLEPGTGTWGTHKFSIQRLSGLHRMVWFLAAFGGYPSPRSGESGQSSTDCSDFCRCFWGFHSAARAEESAARNPKLPKFRIERWALSLPEGAERVSRAAAKLCERSRSSKKGSAGPGGAGEPRRAHTRTVLRPLPGHAVVFGETGGGAQGARLPTG